MVPKVLKDVGGWFCIKFVVGKVLEVLHEATQMLITAHTNLALSTTVPLFSAQQQPCGRRQGFWNNAHISNNLKRKFSLHILHNKSGRRFGRDYGHMSKVRRPGEGYYRQLIELQACTCITVGGDSQIAYT